MFTNNQTKVIKYLLINHKCSRAFFYKSMNIRGLEKSLVIQNISVAKYKSCPIQELIHQTFCHNGSRTSFRYNLNGVTCFHSHFCILFISMLQLPFCPDVLNHFVTCGELYQLDKWTASSEFGTYPPLRVAKVHASEQSRQNLRCSLIQAFSQEEPSDRKPDP